MTFTRENNKKQKASQREWIILEASAVSAKRVKSQTGIVSATSSALLLGCWRWVSARKSVEAQQQQPEEANYFSFNWIRFNMRAIRRCVRGFCVYRGSSASFSRKKKAAHRCWGKNNNNRIHSRWVILDEFEKRFFFFRIHDKSKPQQRELFGRCVSSNYVYSSQVMIYNK